MYYIDSMAYGLDAFDYDIHTGNISKLAGIISFAIHRIIHNDATSLLVMSFYHTQPCFASLAGIMSFYHTEVNHS